jgi:hypothetical protein
MIIVGLTGSIGSGKTTFADYLAAQFKHAGHWESWQLVAEVATALREQPANHPSPTDIEAVNRWLEPLPQILKKHCHAEADFKQLKLSRSALENDPESYDKLLQYLALMQKQPQLQRVAITEQNKETLRPVLQWLGGHLAKTVGGEIWYKEIIRRIRVEPDVELAIIGGVRFPADASEVKAADGYILRIDRPDIAVRDQQDITERERELILADATIYNNGDLQQLQACAKIVADDLKAGKLSQRYSADAE